MLKAVVVDDEPKISFICERILDLAGIQALSFSEPLAALEYLRQKGADVVLADVRMPVMDGFGLLQQVRECCPSTAVVIMTAYGDMSIALKALRAGADGMILKPFGNADLLVKAVQEGVEHRRRSEETARLQALAPLLQVAEALLSESAGNTNFNSLAEQIKLLFPACDFGVYCWEGKPEDGRLLFFGGKAPDDQRVLREVHSLLSEHCGSDECALSPALSEAQGWSDSLAAGVVRGERLYALLLGRSEGKFMPAERTAAAILARLLASALENQRLYAELQRSLENERRSRRALTKAKQMAALGRMMASLAHELNNPLQALSNSLYLALLTDGEGNASGDGKEHRQHLEAANHHLARLISVAERMLDFYRPDASSRTLVQIADLVQDVTKQVTADADRRGVKIVQNLSAGSSKVLVVPAHIKYALGRLAADLLESMGEGDELHFVVTENDDEVSLEVSALSNHTGFPYPSVEAFSQQDVADWESAGVGIAISEGIVSAHGGTLSISASPDAKERTIQIKLPLVHEVSRRSHGNVR